MANIFYPRHGPSSDYDTWIWTNRN